MHPIAPRIPRHTNPSTELGNNYTALWLSIHQILANESHHMELSTELMPNFHLRDLSYIFCVMMCIFILLAWGMGLYCSCTFVPQQISSRFWQSNSREAQQVLHNIARQRSRCNHGSVADGHHHAHNHDEWQEADYGEVEMPNNSVRDLIDPAAHSKPNQKNKNISYYTNHSIEDECHAKTQLCQSKRRKISVSRGLGFDPTIYGYVPEDYVPNEKEAKILQNQKRHRRKNAELIRKIVADRRKYVTSPISEQDNQELQFDEITVFSEQNQIKNTIKLSSFTAKDSKIKSKSKSKSKNSKSSTSKKEWSADRNESIPLMDLNDRFSQEGVVLSNSPTIEDTKSVHNTEGFRTFYLE